MENEHINNTSLGKYNLALCEANAAAKRYIIHQGGSGSGKTYSIMQSLLHYANNHPGTIISVVSETMPHLKRGAMRDLKHILQLEESCLPSVRENKTEHTFIINGSLIEFFPAYSEAKLRGARRDILFINECNNVDYESFQQLDMRTRVKTILDFNPVCRFWVHNNLMASLTEKDYLFVKSTYLTNPFLSEAEKQNIERRRTNVAWWKVYGEGEIGTAEGIVFTNWQIMNIDPPPAQPEIPKQVRNDFPLPGKLLGYGIDFGFTHAPTTVVQLHECNGELYVHELLYRTGMQNDELFEFARQHLNMNVLAVADSAEPKTIDYLYRKGWTGLKSAEKGPDSLLFGLNLLLERKINVTAQSLNLIKEMRQYRWDTNKDGAFIPRPVKEFDHAIDAMRYVFSYPKKQRMLFT